MECEMYVLNDGTLQCGNCGAVFEGFTDTCPECLSVVIGIVDEGEPDDSIWGRP